MAKEAGTKVLLKVGDSGSPETFTALAGQQSTTMTGDATTADVTDKSHSGWTSTMNVLRGLTVQAQGVVDWTDSTGIDVLRGAWQAGTDVNCQLVLNASGAYYQAAFQVTAFNISGEHTDATRYDITLQNNGTVSYNAGS